MFSFSIQSRQALSKLTLPLLIGLSCLVMLLGQADRRLAERARMAFADSVVPVYGAMGEPLAAFHAVVRQFAGLADVAAENERLRRENLRLQRWYDVAVALSAENAELKNELHWMPDPRTSFVTVRAVADPAGVYSRSVLVAVAPDAHLSKGMVAVDAGGLAGRVTEVGARSARVLLITDLSSRVPVTLEASHATAILAGTNAATPRLTDYPEETRPVEGERVITNNVANAFPAGLPVGTVHYLAPGTPVVEPFASLDHVGVLRLFDYGLSGIPAPDAPGRVPGAAEAAPAATAPAGSASGATATGTGSAGRG